MSTPTPPLPELLRAAADWLHPSTAGMSDFDRAHPTWAGDHRGARLSDDLRAAADRLEAEQPAKNGLLTLCNHDDGSVTYVTAFISGTPLPQAIDVSRTGDMGPGVTARYVLEASQQPAPDSGELQRLRDENAKLREDLAKPRPFATITNTTERVR